jgi:mRNA interferase MazF
VISQGDIWWADLGNPVGSAPGHTRPVLVVQGNAYNASRIGTIVCVALTGQMRRADAPGNVRLSAEATGLSKDSVANVSHLTTVDRKQLVERVGRVTQRKLELVFEGIDVVLGR